MQTFSKVAPGCPLRGSFSAQEHTIPNSVAPAVCEHRELKVLSFLNESEQNGVSLSTVGNSINVAGNLDQFSVEGQLGECGGDFGPALSFGIAEDCGLVRARR